MIVGERIKALRVYRGLSQGDLEKKTGMLRCYISRVENDRLTPSLDNLGKLAQALEVPLYALFCEGEDAPDPAFLVCEETISCQDKKSFGQLARLLPKLSPPDRQFLMRAAESLSRVREGTNLSGHFSVLKPHG